MSNHRLRDRIGGGKLRDRIKDALQNKPVPPKAQEFVEEQIREVIYPSTQPTVKGGMRPVPMDVPVFVPYVPPSATAPPVVTEIRENQDKLNFYLLLGAIGIGGFLIYKHMS